MKIFPIFFLLLVFFLVFASCQNSRAQQETNVTSSVTEVSLVSPLPEQLSFESEYSSILLDERGSTRTLYFVRDNGEIVIESQVDVANSENLLIRYTRTMFANYLFNPTPTRVMIVGLGGGAMVKFIEHYDSDLFVDVVEIDPVIVQIADEYFGVRNSEQVHITTGDGFAYLEAATETYDTVYMDAFLKPSNNTDSTGVPLRMQTVRFYEGIQSHLTETGNVIFNLNHGEELVENIEAIRSAFPQTYIFRVMGAGNTIVVGSMNSERVEQSELIERGNRLDALFNASFSFADLARNSR